MVNHLETESQIKVRVPTELKDNWEGVELAVPRKLIHMRELVPFQRDASNARAASQRLPAVRTPGLKKLVKLKYYQFKVSLKATLICIVKHMGKPT